MEETYNIKAIVLRRVDFRENDSRITVYSRERGKMSLVVRGAKKLSSKLSAHVEVATLSSIMVVVGKNMNYVGGISSVNCFAGIKKDFSKLQITGEALRFFDKIMRDELRDKVVFALLQDFLIIINGEKNSTFISSDADDTFLQYRVLLYAFIMKLLSILGYQPDLNTCIVCRKNVSTGEYMMDFLNGGLVCLEHSQGSHFVLSDDVVRSLKFLFESSLSNFMKYELKGEVARELINTIKLFIKYQKII